ncbi:hypothetical protein NL676_021553 [Syzygium grande]|nr:hypothetical protein NL676_021553 [Syzygium grande]
MALALLTVAGTLGPTQPIRILQRTDTAGEIDTDPFPQMVGMMSATIRRSPKPSVLCWRYCREVHQYYFSDDDDDSRMTNGHRSQGDDRFPERSCRMAYNYWHHRNSENRQPCHGVPSHAQQLVERRVDYANGRRHSNNRIVHASSSRRPKILIKKRTNKVPLGQLYKEEHPDVSTLGKLSGKYGYYVRYLAHKSSEKVSAKVTPSG